MFNPSKSPFDLQLLCGLCCHNEHHHHAHSAVCSLTCLHMPRERQLLSQEWRNIVWLASLPALDVAAPHPVQLCVAVLAPWKFDVNCFATQQQLMISLHPPCTHPHSQTHMLPREAASPRHGRRGWHAASALVACIVLLRASTVALDTAVDHCPYAPAKPGDRRTNPSRLRVVHLNAEYLMYDAGELIR
jgi:hypothetical protein